MKSVLNLAVKLILERFNYRFLLFFSCAVMDNAIKELFNPAFSGLHRGVQKLLIAQLR